MKKSLMIYFLITILLFPGVSVATPTVQNVGECWFSANEIKEKDGNKTEHFFLISLTNALGMELRDQKGAILVEVFTRNLRRGENFLTKTSAQSEAIKKEFKRCTA